MREAYANVQQASGNIVDKQNTRVYIHISTCSIYILAHKSIFTQTNVNISLQTESNQRCTNKTAVSAAAVSQLINTCLTHITRGVSTKKADNSYKVTAKARSTFG